MAIDLALETSTLDLPIPSPPPEWVPPLQQGDRLTRDEFLRRYEAMPELKKAELVEGKVYMSSPVTAEDHAEPHFKFNGILFVYAAKTPGVVGGDNATLMLDLQNAPQPDGYLRLLPEAGGQARLVNRYLEGAPELVTEVAASSKSYDLHDKLNAYRRNGVREYVVWRVWDRAVDWFILRNGQLIPLPTQADGIYRSEVFAGLWLDAAAVVSGNIARVLDVLQEGLASEPHRAFAQRISEMK
jgi:Uma2 family endonuclease